MKNRIDLLLLFISLLATQVMQGQTIIKQDGKFGLADLQGNTIHKPVYDSIFRMSKFTDINLFYIKQNNKYAYCYYLEFDSTTWFNESQKKWITSPFEFDSLQGFWIGDLHYHSGFGYTTIGYKKNGLWGILFVQTHSGSGGGMFPSTGFYVDGLGKMTQRENKYDQITISEKDNFYTTRLKDKYGFWEPITNEVYEPEFDSIPITKRKDYSTEDLPRHRFVKKNGKWGLIYLNESTQTIEYKVPCLCNALGGINAELYYCKGKDDTLQIYFTPTNKILKPIIEGNQIKLDFYWKPWDNDTHFTFQKYIGENTLILGNDSIFYELRLRHKQELILYKMKNIPEPFPVLGDYAFDKTTQSVYAINIQENKIIFALTDTTCSYFSGYAPFIIINAHYNSKTKKYTRYFYDDQTGALKFSITTQEKFLFMGEVKKKKRRGQTTWYKFTSSRTTSSDHGAVRGYYNLTTKKFSRFRR